MKTGESLISARLVSRIVMGLVMAGTCIRAGATEPKIAICLDKGINPAVVSQAQAIAGRMFSRIDVGIRWYGYHGSCPVRDDKPLMVQMSSQTAENTLPGALARALPFEGIHILIFYDRVRATVDAGMVPLLLAHVLVHEIAHAIEGTDQHSDSGIMKARWDAEDYQQMRHSSLSFTKEDLQLIRAGMAGRIAAGQNQDPKLRLRSYNQAHVPDRIVSEAQREVTSIFKRIGVKAEWVTDSEPQYRILIVDAVVGPPGTGKDTFGSTPRAPDGTLSGRAYVAYGRIKQFIADSEKWRDPPLDPEHVLAYFITHEVGHLLLPTGSRSPTGIMRAQWRAIDFKLMATSNMTFTPEQAKLIKNEVARQSRKFEQRLTDR
jgi:hypothetical protein